ncbi:hypothetical protein [Levilactobacillus lettrarii]
MLQAGIQWSQEQRLAYLLPDSYLLLALALKMVPSQVEAELS